LFGVEDACKLRLCWQLGLKLSGDFLVAAQIKKARIQAVR
jgi:hypothetical protein